MTKQKIVKSENKHMASFETLSTKDFGLTAPDKNLSMVGFSTWVRALMQNWRQGTVGCKDRSEVAFSNRKPWKQKGTGRARAGSLRSPLWRKGGVIFGPQPRVRTLKVSKSLRKTVLGAIAYNQLDAGKVAYLDWALSGDKPQTRVAYDLLKKAQLADKNVTIFLPVNDALTYASFINIPSARILFYDQANAFDLVRGGNWIVFKKDIDLFKEMVGQWI